MTEFNQWKEREEEITYTTYVCRDRTYQPQTNGKQIWLAISLSFCQLIIIDVHLRHYFVCCRDGNYKGNKGDRITEEKRPTQKPSRKINQHCLSRMYVDEYHDGHVEVTYITAHSGHDLGTCELPYLPLPISTKENVAMKVSQGIPPERIIDGIIVLYHCTLGNYLMCLCIQISERELVIATNDLTFCKVYQESTSSQNKMFEISARK